MVLDIKIGYLGDLSIRNAKFYHMEIAVPIINGMDTHLSAKILVELKKFRLFYILYSKCQ